MVLEAGRTGGTPVTVSVDLARQLLDLGARLRRPEHGDSDPPQAQEQLRGAVAIHNILAREGVAYLADEVGMGKTYVALGAIALFRHFNPGFRVAVIAPRENIQDKWMKEWFNFATHIVRIPDLRVKALDGSPARPLVKCNNLQQFIRETTVDADRDFFLRLSSFSLATGEDESDVRALRGRFQRELPWLPDVVTSLRKREFKDSLAKALCCALPEFDLLVVDEAHNLKHGFAERIAARNRVLAFMFGRPSEEVDRRQFRDYGPRAKRVLFLSATPIEDNYRQLWNQLDVFGKADAYRNLREPLVSEEQKRALAQRFLVRRVTTLNVGGKPLTKNLYRREWRRGGLISHDDPIRVDNVRERLVVALVQKKVAELLNTPKFGARFQMGMLASFESFLETVKLRASDGEAGNFDDAEQTEDPLEREGVDVPSINRLAADYRQRFNGRALPHPKMDALVSHLSDSWRRGRKALVFFRRVASVWEIKERLDLRHSEWLIERLRREFGASNQLVVDINALYETFCAERLSTRSPRLAARMGADAAGREGEQDRGGDDTFFAWFFRGEGPPGRWLTGAKFAQRFAEAGYELSTYFEDNYAADLLKAAPGTVAAALAEAVGMSAREAEAELVTRAGQYLTQARRPGRRELFEAAQGGAVELLRDKARDPRLKHRAEVVWQLRFELRQQRRPASATPPASALERATFFTALRLPEWSELRAAVWPEPHNGDFEATFREQELRRELLGTAARLGHPLIDLYVIAMRQRGTLRTRAAQESDADAVPGSFIDALLTALDTQRRTPVADREWGAFDELSAIAEHFDLILDVNEPDARTKRLAEAGRLFGALLRQQQPTGGMTGQVNRTLVRQFRMPGYPFVLLSTDLLQEGEDLHTFCSHVYHYGLAWTPSAIEQRIGRVDRVRSQTERVAMTCKDGLPDRNRLQVYYPHLEDTIERLQVRRVVRRMHEFIRLMHEGLAVNAPESSRLNLREEIVGVADLPELTRTPLKTAFPVRDKDLAGDRRSLALTHQMAIGLAERLRALARMSSLSGLPVTWEEAVAPHALLGTLQLASGRAQPFKLHLDTFGEHLVVRCVSPVGRLDDAEAVERVRRISRRVPEQLGIVEEADDRGIDLTVEEEVLLGDPAADVARMSWLVVGVAKAADRLEEGLWGERDAPFDAFRAALIREGRVPSHAD
jgi:hypothetical protein